MQKIVHLFVRDPLARFELLGVAAIVASIPNPVWYAAIVLVFIFLGITAYFHRNSIESFVTAVFVVVVVIVGTAIIVHYVRLIYKAWIGVHSISMQNIERQVAKEKLERQRLQNEMLVTKIEMERQLPGAMARAFEYGLNVEYDKFKMTDWRSNMHMLNAGAKVEQITAPEYVPEPFKFSDVLQGGWRPNKDGILLAKKEDMILCPTSEGLCHTTFTGNTDSGKTSDERLILIQLLYLREIVFICDKNYQSQRLDKKSGLVYDYRPIERLLAHEPITSSRGTLNFLAFALQELDKRRELRRYEPVEFPDWYIFIDELPAFCAEESKIMKHVGRIVREARQYGLFFVGAAQDMLLNTLGGDNGAVRKNFLTNFYGGGDTTTARMMLNLATGESLDETGLGKMGVKYIRAKGVGIEKVKARVPLSDNLATHILLTDLVPLPQIEIPEVAESVQSNRDLDIVYEACIQLKEEGLKVSSRAVEERTGINRTTANRLIGVLESQGTKVR